MVEHADLRGHVAVADHRALGMRRRARSIDDARQALGRDLGRELAVRGRVGPESEGFVGCTTGAPLRFRIDGQPAAPTATVNTPPGQRKTLDLKLQ